MNSVLKNSRNSDNVEISSKLIFSNSKTKNSEPEVCFHFFTPPFPIFLYSSEHDELTVFSLSVVDMEKFSFSQYWLTVC